MASSDRPQPGEISRGNDSRVEILPTCEYSTARNAGRHVELAHRQNQAGDQPPHPPALKLI
jgi:hypothetical protein